MPKAPLSESPTAGTEHVVVGAGDGPCVILMCGARTAGEQVRYPVSELAARYSASVNDETSDPGEAHAPFGKPELQRPPRWDSLPWS